MAFNTSFNPQLLAQQPSTPVKTEPSSSASTSTTDLTDQIRFLNAAGPLMPQMPHVPPSISAETIRQMQFAYPMFAPGHPMDVKPEMLPNTGGPLMTGLIYDPYMTYHPYLSQLDGGRRKNATRETTAHLKNWLNEHRKNPYPTKAEKIMLALLTKMTLTQVSTWFANARRRLKKENKMTWSHMSRADDEDDDDDFGDIDNLDRDQLERASSSDSDKSDRKKDKADVTIDSSNNQATNTKGEGSSKTQSADDVQSEAPRKNKIWSIADTIEDKGKTEQEQKDEAAPATSSEKVESQLREDVRSASTSNNLPIPPMTPQNVFHFNQWHQQVALAMTRLPYTRTGELFPPMIPSGQFRPPMFFSPSLMNAAAVLSSSQSVPVPPSALAQTNGCGIWSEQCTTGSSAHNTPSRNANENEKCKSERS